jgi:hypothetical protein
MVSPMGRVPRASRQRRRYDDSQLLRPKVRPSLRQRVHTTADEQIKSSAYSAMPARPGRRYQNAATLLFESIQT